MDRGQDDLSRGFGLFLAYRSQNGDSGLLFEKDDHKQNMFVRFTLEWLTDGGDRYEAPKTK